MTHTHRPFLLLALLALAPTALAQDGPPRGAGHGPPPPEAIQACEALGDGDACSFEAPHGVEEGSCWAPDETLPLACKPEGAPEPPRR